MTALRTEWIKLITVRSTWWTVALAVIVSIGISALICLAVPSSPEFDALSRQDPNMVFDITQAGSSFGGIVVIVLGVMVMAPEYQNSLIRSTFAADPRRQRVLAAKAAIAAALSLAIGLTVSCVSYLVGSIILHAQDVEVSVSGTEGGVRVLIGGGVVFAASAVFSLAVATVFRNTALAITSVLMLSLVLPALIQLIPTYGDDIAKFLPFNAGSMITSTGPTAAGELSPLLGAVVMLAWVAVLYGLAALLFERRDA